MFKKTLYLLFLVIVIISCINTKNNVGSEQIETAVQSEEAREIRPIDIKSPKFFWRLKPWKEGKLATIDGWGRFAEISFEKNNRIRIKHLVNFPRRQLDRVFRTWPDADLLWTQSGQMEYLADVRNKKTKAFIPLLTWTYDSCYPVLLDKEEGLILFSYSTFLNGQTVFRHIYYNYLKDEIVSNTGVFQPLDFLWAIDRELVLVDDFSQSYPYGKDKGFVDFYIYNRITGEKIRNKFTDTVRYLIPYILHLQKHDAMSWERRYLISDLQTEGYDGDFKISWNEDFSEVEVLPIREILRQQLRNQRRYYATYFVLSPDGEWATASVGGYRGLYEENLYKRAFYHMDNKYPGGMSMPILPEEYEGDNEPDGSFVNHPEYGMCFAQEGYKEEDGRDQLYLRLYKMSDVLAEINRRLLKAEDVLKE
jgi:hypothetical protein